MTGFHGAPEIAYGVFQQDRFDTDIAILDSGCSDLELRVISDAFESARANYIRRWGENRLRVINEYHTMRAPLTHGGPEFLALATNCRLLSALKRLINGSFVLTQQNGVINPPGKTYNQRAWHRDLPYQHYVSSSPLAVNALFCVDDFTLENGSTFVLPATHKAVDHGIGGRG